MITAVSFFVFFPLFILLLILYLSIETINLFYKSQRIIKPFAYEITLYKSKSHDKMQHRGKVLLDKYVSQDLITNRNQLLSTEHSKIYWFIICKKIISFMFIMQNLMLRNTYNSRSFNRTSKSIINIIIKS